MFFNNYELFIKYICDKSNEKEIYIWGVSVYGNYLGRLLNEKNIKWSGYFDNYSVDINKQYNGKNVYSGKNICCNDNVMYILSMRSYEAVYKQLKLAGIKDEQIIAISDVSIFSMIEDEVINVSQYSKKIKKFQDIHNGERCFIIGNGPSLKIDDLQRLKNEHTFACNLIFQCFDKTEWRPEYYFFLESNSTTFESRELVKNLMNNCSAAFVRGGGSLYKYRDDKDLDDLYYMKMKLPENIESISFSDDCSLEVYSGTTTTYAMIQMAAYMGFKKIYLIGIDHTFSKIIDKNGNVHDGVISKGEEHAAFLGSYNLPNGSEVYKAENAYCAARKYCEMNNIEIYNATRGGMLEIFERTDFDSLFEK